MDQGSNSLEQSSNLLPVAHNLVSTAEKTNFNTPPSTTPLQGSHLTEVPLSLNTDPKGDNAVQILPTAHPTLQPPTVTQGATNTPNSAHQGSEEGGTNEEQEDDSLASSGSEFHPKLPILRLKKTGGGEDKSATFERAEDTSKNDSYCWVCHDGGDVLCCDNCARVFHVGCSGLSKAPEGEEDWFCPVCKNISRKTKRSRPPNLKDLLLLAVNRMMFPGTEIFQHAVPDDIMTHYREYIFFPVDLGKIKEKVKAGKYSSTREFLHDTEWILHNCIIYNGAKHALTKIAKGIVKVCKEDMREIELCPSCYSLTVEQPEDWFCTPCNPPHRVVLAKVRGYPLWPAKLISETSDKCDVRFFGQHDRSLVTKSSIQELNGPPPTPTSKTQFWNIAMYELKRYRENIDRMVERMGGKMTNTNSGSKPAKELKAPKVQREGAHRSPSQAQHNHVDYDHQEGGVRYSQEALINQQTLPVSNYVPFSPQLVEVSVNLSETEDGSMHGNSATLMQPTETTAISEPSSPGSEPELQIDLGGSGGRGQLDKGRASRVAPPAKSSMLGSMKRSPMALDFNSSRQTITSPIITSSSPLVSTPSSRPPPFRRKGQKPGEALSALATSLAKRAGLSSTPGDVGNSMNLQDAMEMDPSQDDSDEAKATHLNSQFSSVYLDRAKTAIAVVDPDQKRLRKRKKISIEQTPKKVPRVQNTSKTITPTTSSPNLIIQGEAMAASLTCQVNAAVNFGRQKSPSPVKADLLKPKIAENGHVSPTTASPGREEGRGGGAGGGGGGSGKGGGGATGRNRGGKFVLGVRHTGKKAKGRTKNVSHAKSTSPSFAATTTSSAAMPATTSTSSLSSTPQAQTLTVPVSIQDLTPTTAATTRGGGVIMPRGGLVEEESPEFAEGSGLLAETVRKVDRSFRARINQMAGGSEDMGYQYFSEKLMTSIKAVLIEMLSTFEAKGKMGAKQLKEQLHTAWPIPDSTVALANLRKELVNDMKQSLEVVRASSELERQQVVSEVRRQAEAEKEIAIAETKKKKWCSYCWKEAQYNCCWNANYCNEVCQQAHWPEHMKNCTQVPQQQQQPQPQQPQQQQPLPPRTPSAVETPVMKIPPMQIPMIATATLIQDQPQQQQTFVYTNPTQGGQGIIVNQNTNSSVNPSVSTMHPVPPPTLPTHHHPHHHHHQSAHRSSISHEQPSPLMPVVSNGLQQVVDPQPMEQAIEHIPNESVVMNQVNAVSPPNHIRDLILNQQSNKSPVITGPNPVLVSSTPGGRLIDNSLTLVSSLNSDHSSNSSSLALHSQPPMSPVSPTSENPPSVHNPGFSWPYQQPVLIGGENFTHTLPLLPTMQASTPTTQNQAFFKGF